MATNDKKESVVQDPSILVVDGVLSHISQLTELLNTLSTQKIKELVIFARDFDNSVLEAFKIDRVHDQFKVLAIKVNVWDIGILEDICSVTNARLVEAFSNPGISMIGHATKIVSNRLKTIIFGGIEDKSEAINLLKIDLDITTAPFDKQKIKERIARVSGKIGLIKVGAVTEIEQGRLRDKIDDAVHACLGALQEGYVTGGGITFTEIANILKSGNIFDKALRAPFQEIGIEIGSEIIDSVKSLRVATESACISVCSLLAGVTIVDKNEIDTE